MHATATHTANPASTAANALVRNANGSEIVCRPVADVPADELDAAILSLIRDWRSATPPELIDGLKHRNAIDASGNMSMELPGNVYLWVGVAPQLNDAIDRLLRQSRIYIDITEPIVFFMCGHGLSFPYARRPPKAGYRKPHWMPVVFRLIGVRPNGKRTALYSRNQFRNPLKE